MYQYFSGVHRGDPINRQRYLKWINVWPPHPPREQSLPTVPPNPALWQWEAIPYPWKKSLYSFLTSPLQVLEGSPLHRKIFFPWEKPCPYFCLIPLAAFCHFQALSPCLHCFTMLPRLPDHSQPPFCAVTFPPRPWDKRREGCDSGHLARQCLCLAGEQALLIATAIYGTLALQVAEQSEAKASAETLSSLWC